MTRLLKFHNVICTTSDSDTIKALTQQGWVIISEQAYLTLCLRLNSLTRG